ncbi:hypothetical protein BSKO_08473 [Bryopsis sp. KO-2023]|nr:hypothetical protein BSKO_08473 [Bryopsis sp. KO-2023]
MAAVSSRGGTFLGIDPSNLGEGLSDSISCVSTNESESDDASLEEYDSCDEGMPAYPPSTASTSCTYVDALDWHEIVEFRPSGQSDAIEGVQRGTHRYGLELPTFDATLGLPEVPPNDRFFPYTQFDQEKNWRSMLTQQNVAGLAKHLNAVKDPYEEILRRYRAGTAERKEWDADRKAAISSHIDAILGKKAGSGKTEQLSQPRRESDGQPVSEKEQEKLETKESEVQRLKSSGEKQRNSPDQASGIAAPPTTSAGSFGHVGFGKFLSSRGLPLDSLQMGGSQEPVKTEKEADGSDREGKKEEAEAFRIEMQKKQREAAQLRQDEQQRKAAEVRRSMEEAREKERQMAEQQKALEEQRQAEVRRNEAAREMAAKQAELRAAEARKQQQQHEDLRRALAAAAEVKKRQEAAQLPLAVAAAATSTPGANIFQLQSPLGMQQQQSLVAGNQQGFSQPPQSSVSHAAAPSQVKPPLQSSTGLPRAAEPSVMLHESESAKQFEVLHKQRSDMFKQRIGAFGSDPGFKKERRVLDKQLKTEITQVSGNLQQVYQKAERIIKVLDGLPEDRRFYCYQTLAQIMMSKCDGLTQNLVFPLAEVLMKVVRKHPLLLDALLSALHKVCVMTVPKYFSLKGGAGGDAERREMMNYKQIEEGTGTRLETEDEFVTRQSGYIMLFAGLLQVDDGKNSSGVNEAWMYLARLLNALPPTRVTATALENFLRIAGSKLFYRYKNQMVKLLQFMDSHFLKQLGESGEVEVRAIYTRLYTYLSTEKFREEPEGWRMPDRDESSFTQA